MDEPLELITSAMRRCLQVLHDEHHWREVSEPQAPRQTVEEAVLGRAEEAGLTNQDVLYVAAVADVTSRRDPGPTKFTMTIAAVTPERLVTIIAECEPWQSRADDAVSSHLHSVRVGEPSGTVVDVQQPDHDPMTLPLVAGSEGLRVMTQSGDVDAAVRLLVASSAGAPRRRGGQLWT